MTYLYELDSRLNATGFGDPHPTCGTECSIFCESCGRIRREYMPRPLWAVMRTIMPGATIDLANQPAMAIFRTALLSHLPYVDDHIRGPVTMHDGSATEYATLYATRPLQILGGRDPGMCPECRQWRRDESAANPFVMHGELDSSLDFFQDEMSTPIISERLRDSIPWDLFPDIELRPLAVKARL